MATNYTVHEEMNDGIERITYRPNEPKFKTPIVFQHGAWHGAWCWKWWQELFADWGWVSHAHSLPAHGGSDAKPNIRFCTYQIYLRTLQKEVERAGAPPIVIGHSMGGMVTQWYLKHVGDLPSAVLVASMPQYEQAFRYLRTDPVGSFLSLLALHAKPIMRTPEIAAKALISEGALMSAEDLHTKLDPESLLLSLQVNRLVWQPRPKPDTRMLVVAAENDAVFSVAEEQHLAEFYGADYKLFENTAHNMMMERTYQDSARFIHDWLSERVD